MVPVVPVVPMVPMVPRYHQPWRAQRFAFGGWQQPGHHGLGGPPRAGAARAGSTAVAEAMSGEVTSVEAWVETWVSLEI